MPGTPGPYAAWVSWLEAFGRGEDLPGTHLPPISEDMGPHMQERLLRHVSEAFHSRQRRWSAAVQRDRQLLLVDPARAATALAVLMHNAKNVLGPLREFTEHPRFPPELRKSLRVALRDSVTSAQRSLEDSTREAPAELRAAVRTNSLVPALTRPRAVTPKPGGAPGRRVIL